MCWPSSTAGGDAGREASLERLVDVAVVCGTAGDVAGGASGADGGGLSFRLVVCPLCYLVGRCKGGWNGWEYLGFRRVGWPKVLFWVLVTFLCGLGFNVAAPHLGVDATPEFMVRVAESTQYPVLMVLGIVVGAPLVEEFVFRGVVFRGWAASGMGPWLTIALTSLMWTALHVQYDVVVLAWLFLLGLLIGYVRHRTGSIWGPLVMHAFNNALASVEIMHLIA